MQSDSIVLPVDPANNSTVVNETFTRYKEAADRTTYIGSGHTPEMRNEMSIYRTFPSRSGNFKGTAKSSLKFTEDKEVAGVDSSITLTAPMILEVSFSLPLGVTAADIKALRQRAIAALDADTFMDGLNIQLMI